MHHIASHSICCYLSSAYGTLLTWPPGLQVGSLARELRAAGHFTVAALTRPFGFEGARKLAAADSLIAELEQIAHLVRFRILDFGVKPE